MADRDPYEAELQAVAADLDRLVRRLRLFSPRTWLKHRDTIRELLSEWVRIAEVVEGRSLSVPEIADHVLADAVAVIGQDLVDALRDRPLSASIRELDSSLIEALAATR